MQFVFNSFVAIALLVANAGALPRPAAEPLPPYSIVNVDGGSSAAPAAGPAAAGGPAAGGPGPLTVTVTQPAQKIIQTVTITTTVTMNNDTPAMTTDAAVITTDGMVLTKPANVPADATLSVVENASTTEIIDMSASGSERAKATPVHHSNGVVTLTMEPTPSTTIHDNGQWHTFYPTDRTTMTMKAEPTTVAW